MRLVRLGSSPAAEMAAVAHLFDSPIKPDAVHRFLSDPTHHMLVAYVGSEAAGFVSGVELTHPDKGTEMFLYELGVGERYRRQGVASALVDALKELARDRGCYGMWVLCDEDNEAALKLYEKVGGTASKPVLFDWSFEA